MEEILWEKRLIPLVEDKVDNQIDKLSSNKTILNKRSLFFSFFYKIKWIWDLSGRFINKAYVIILNIRNLRINW